MASGKESHGRTKRLQQICKASGEAVEASTKMCDTISPDRDFCRKATSKRKRIAYVTTQQRYGSVYRNFGWYREGYASFAPISGHGRFYFTGVPNEANFVRVDIRRYKCYTNKLRRI